MATVATPYGFKPMGNVISAAYNHKTRTFTIASAYNTSIFYGDPVIPVTGGGIQRDPMTTALTAPGVLGIFLGCSYTDPNTLQKIFKQFWPASTVATDAIAYVFDDPEGVFMIQADGAVPLTSNFGNFSINNSAAAGWATFGNSKISVLFSSVAATTTLPIRCIGFVNGPTSAVGDAFTDMIVRWNFGIHTYHNFTGLA